MKMAAKMILLSLPVFFLAICTLPAKASDGNTPPPPPPQNISQPEPGQGNERGEMFMRGKDFMTKILEKIKKDDPNEATKLETLRKEDPHAFRTEFIKYTQEHGLIAEGPEQNQPDMGEPPMGMRGREMVREHIQARENELMAWLEKNEPAKAKELAALKAKDPAAYGNRMMFEMKKYRQIMEAEQTNPALAEVLKKELALKQKRNDLLEQIKGTTDEAKKKDLTEQLKTVVGDSFDLIVQKKQLKYEELKKKLEELQQNIKKSQTELESIKSKKAEQVEQRMKDLLSQSEKVDWD